MKSTKVIFWTTTTILFLFEGVMPALTSQSEMAKEGIRHLGYPAYFGGMLAVFKTLGGLALIIPQVPKRIKEWAYAGYTIDFIAAVVSYMCVEGCTINVLFPIIAIVIIIASYVSYHKLNKVYASE